MGSDINIWLNRNPYKDKKRAKPYSDGILQHLLRNALNSSVSVEVFKTQQGKPYVNEAVYFSHSNCRQLHAYVISNEHEVAIDVEAMEENKPIQKLAQRYFCAAEVQQISALAGSEKVNRFYELWTQKEAWCKLEGGNLWSYLGKNVYKNQQLNFHTTGAVMNYTMTLASSSKIDRVWINSIGNQ